MVYVPSTAYYLCCIWYKHVIHNARFILELKKEHKIMNLGLSLILVLFLDQSHQLYSNTSPASVRLTYGALAKFWWVVVLYL